MSFQVHYVEMVRKRFALVLLFGAFLLASAALAVPAVVTIPIVQPHGSADPQEPGVFSHWQHDQYQCVACHPGVFPRARMGFTHDQMDEGRFCGACHDGRTAPPVSGSQAKCKSLCHVR
jgi:c(7)-type cytochrome triheme protein